jgi:hypothetical protein
MMRNEALFEKVAAQIEEWPDDYDQATYGKIRFQWVEEATEGPVRFRTGNGVVEECGTSACVAGWALLLSGWSINREQSKAHFVRGDEWLETPEVFGKAADLLGLEMHEAAALFDGNWMAGAASKVPDALRRIAKGEDPSEVHWRYTHEPLEVYRP